MKGGFGRCAAVRRSPAARLLHNVEVLIDGVEQLLVLDGGDRHDERRAECNAACDGDAQPRPDADLQHATHDELPRVCADHGRCLP